MSLIEQVTQPCQKSYLIPLTRGLFAVVDAEDYGWVRKHKWYAHWDSVCDNFYATRCRYIDGRKTSISMHREIMGEPEGLFVDHINPSLTLDNRRSNLRVATKGESVCNRKRGRNNTSGFKGVRKRRHVKGWVAEIQFKGRKYYLGRFDSKEDAHAAYCLRAHELHGKFARVA